MAGLVPYSIKNQLIHAYFSGYISQITNLILARVQISILWCLVLSWRLAVSRCVGLKARYGGANCAVADHCRVLHRQPITFRALGLETSAAAATLSVKQATYDILSNMIGA